jgi:hypothetical protein
MKRTSSIILLVTVIITVTTAISFAQQIRTPRPSPTATLTQEVGLSTVTINYSRPGVKDRVIFGGLLPYGTLWRTGANSATTISFSDDVSVEGHSVKAGKYALFTIPGKDEWTIILNSNYDQNGTSEYKESEDALRFTVKPYHLAEKVESFTIDINNIANSTASINLLWENTLVSFEVDVNTDERVMASIKQALDPASDAGKYNTAANYYFTTGKDLNQALAWINKSIELSPDSFYSYYLKSNIQAKMGNYKDAVTTAQKSKDMATQAKNDEFVTMNQNNITKWQSMK